MRTKIERRMLHIAEKPASNKSNLSKTSGVYYAKTRGKNFKVTRVTGQDYYQELKTRKQIEKES